MMLLGIRPPSQWNEAYLNMKTSTSPEAPKVVKNFIDFNASRVYGFLLWTIFILCVMQDKVGPWSAYIITYLPKLS